MFPDFLGEGRRRSHEDKPDEHEGSETPAWEEPEPREKTTRRVILDPGISLLECLVKRLAVRDKKDLMRTNLYSEQGLRAVQIINAYLESTGQDYRLIKEDGNVVLIEKLSRREIAKVPVGTSPIIPKCTRPFVIEDPKPQQISAEEGKSKAYFNPGTRGNPRHYKIRDVWAMLGNYGLNLSVRISSD